MAAVKLVKVDAVIGMMFRTVPPAPVAALGDQQFLISPFAAILGNAISVFRIGLAGSQEEFPGAIVLLGADPDVETGVNPGPRENVIEPLRFQPRQRFRNG